MFSRICLHSFVHSSPNSQPGVIRADFQNYFPAVLSLQLRFEQAAMAHISIIRKCRKKGFVGIAKLFLPNILSPSLHLINYLLREAIGTHT